MALRMTMYERLEQGVHPWVIKGELDRAISHCETEMAKLPKTEYHAVIGRSWVANSRCLQMAGALLPSRRQGIQSPSYLLRDESVRDQRQRMVHRCVRL